MKLVKSNFQFLALEGAKIAPKCMYPFRKEQRVKENDYILCTHRLIGKSLASQFYLSAFNNYGHNIATNGKSFQISQFVSVNYCPAITQNLFAMNTVTIMFV